MTSGKPTREQADLAEVLEMVLDKGIVINADIAVTVGETELLGVELRAAIASFETAAEYGLAFPSGTDMRRVEQASGRQPLEDEDSEILEGEAREAIDLGIDASSGGESTRQAGRGTPGARPTPTVRSGDGSEDGTDGDENDASDADGSSSDADAQTDDTDDESNDTEEEDA